MQKFQRNDNNKGFTLIEILLIVAALAIISGLTIVAINPVKQLAEARNGERRIDVGILWSALHQYSLDNHGSLPTNIAEGTLSNCTEPSLTDPYTICRTDQCVLTLSELLVEEKYLVDIPTDPRSFDDNFSGYNIILDTDHNNRLTVCAPGAEEGAVIVLPEQ